MEAAEDLAHEVHLVLFENLADGGLHDVPVVIHLGPERVIEVEADHLALFVGQGAVELLHERFARGGGGAGVTGGDETGETAGAGG